jgi:hypothetical protein
MALVLANRVRETTTTTGTGTVTLAGAVTGFQDFTVIGNANTTYYTIAGQTTSEWEVGIGTYTLSGTTLARTTVLASSNGGTAVNFSAGTKDVFVTYPSSKSVYLDASGNTVITGTSTNTFYQINYVVNAVTVTSNAGTVPITYRLNNFTNSSAAAMAITMTTTSAVDGQMSIVRIYDFSAAAQVISYVNTENSTVTAPLLSNGSTTLPLTVGFMYNSQTSKWRCIASA